MHGQLRSVYCRWWPPEPIQGRLRSTRTHVATAIKGGNVMAASARLDNVLRYQRGMTSGHVESYFWRANDPTSKRAFWLKATILARVGTQPAIADLWCCTFNGVTGHIWGDRQTVALDDARFEGAPLEIDIGQASFRLDVERGRAKGSLKNEDGACSWDLTWSPGRAPLSDALSIFPFRWMLHTGIPRSKTVTPHPVLAFNGEMNWSGETIAVQNWTGMQGHNWGKEHTPEYAWGQCVFTDGTNPACMVEAFSGRIKVAGQLSPAISAMVIRYEDQELRFDRMLNLWSQSAHVEYPKWTLTMKGPKATAELHMVADPSQMICLGYMNPDGTLSYCLNSKLARTTLRVTPKKGQAFELVSDFGGALEFLMPENPGFDLVI